MRARACHCTEMKSLLRKAFTRRTFLKFSAVAGALAWLKFMLGGAAAALESAGRHISRTTYRPHKGVPSTCLNCYARCGIIGYTEYGRAIKIGGNPENPNSRGRLCAKGQAGLNVLYDPERVLHPLKRVGKRGEGRWKKISWDEALSEISGKLKALQSQGRQEEFIFQSERDITTQDLARRFLHAFGSPNCFNRVSLGGHNKKTAHQLTWGSDLELGDISRSDYILNFGSNPYEAYILRASFVQRLAEARTLRIFDARVHERAKLVTFDVRVSQTAGKSDEWHPVKPGTDAVVALAMANVIMQKGLYDRKFLRQWTNYSIEGLKRHLAQYTPELAESISGVSASDIRRIAMEFASARSATTISTGGVTKHLNGVYSERCIILLNVITGNIDVKGGYCLPRYYTFSEPSPVPPIPEKKCKVKTAQDEILGREVGPELFPFIKEGGIKVGVYMTYQHNPAYAYPDTLLVNTVLKDESLVPFFVAIDTHISETASLADIVLPAATYLERWELESAPCFEMVPFISLRQPIVQPLGQSKAFSDILIDLARKLGGVMEVYFNFTTLEYLERTIASVDKLRKAGGIEYLRQHGVWHDPDAKPDYGLYKKKGFNTPSGKVEVYSHKLKRLGFNPLPVYVPIKAHSSLSGKEFILTTFQWNVHTHFKTANCKWLSEITHANPAWINASVAAAYGIKDGDAIKITSRSGSMLTKANVTEGIHPQVIAVSDSCGHWEYGHTAQAKRFKSSDPETDLLWWGKEGHGAHPNSIISMASDPVGGGQAWMDTVVSVEKV